MGGISSPTSKAHWLAPETRRLSPTRFAILRGARVAQVSTMNLSVKSECAAAAIFDLAVNCPGSPVKIGPVVKRRDIAKKCLDPVAVGTEPAPCARPDRLRRPPAPQP
jgi:hypothetical protein